MRWVCLLGRCAAVVVLAACATESADQFDNFDGGPGSDAWGSASVVCSTSDDCLGGEMCLSGTCQVSRCEDGPYTSLPPVGSHFNFFYDREFAVADSAASQGDYYVDGYTHTNGTIDYAGSWDTGSDPVLDIASGNLVGGRPDEIAAARSGEKAVALLGTDGETIDTDIYPAFVDVADTDASGIDELVAVDTNGEIRVCFGKQGCNAYSFEGGGVTALDAAAGDVDGDGFDEVVVLIKVGDAHQLIGLNVDHETTNQVLSFGDNVPAMDYISVADVDGDVTAEVVTVDDDGCGLFGCGNDTLRLFRLSDAGAFELGSTSVDDDIQDVEAADLDRDQIAEIVLLRDQREYRVMRGDLSTAFTGTLNVQSTPNRITLSDFDGDSPAGKLVSGPDILPGNMVPSMVIHLPPYSREHSDGGSSVLVGQGESTSETFSDTVSMSAGITVGVQGDFLGLFKSELSTRIKSRVALTEAYSSEIYVGDRLSLTADPERFGPQYAAVYLTAACYHSYTYEMDDPAGLIGGDGSEFQMFVPVEARSVLWSSHRYNALADRIEGLPKVTVNHYIGDVSSYPSQPLDADGKVVNSADMVFPNPPTIAVSDVGDIGSWLSVSETVTNEINTGLEVTTSGSITVPGLVVGGEVGAGFETGYSISLGQAALFGGAVPPIYDDPSTPEDEYSIYGYSFAPYVYTRDYTNSAGETQSLYEYDFMAGQ